MFDQFSTTHLAPKSAARVSIDQQLVQTLREMYGGPRVAAKIRDRRLRLLATIIENAPDDWRAIQSGIKGTGLSCAYLSVRFKAEAQLPMRSYALWLKFEHACILVRAGATPRDAAICAGFADQSHLGRAARRFAKKSFGQVQVELARRLAQPVDGETNRPEPAASYNLLQAAS